METFIFGFIIPEVVACFVFLAVNGFSPTKRSAWIFAAVNVAVVAVLWTPIVLQYLDDTVGPSRLLQGWSKIILFPTGLAFAYWALIAGFAISHKAGQSNNRMTRAQSPGILVLGLVVTVLLLGITFKSFRSGIDILRGKRPVRIGYETLEKFMQAYARVWANGDNDGFKKRLLSPTIAERLSATDEDALRTSMARFQGQQPSWDWSVQSETNESCIVVIRDRSKNYRQEIHVRKMDGEWRLERTIDMGSNKPSEGTR